MQNRSTTLAAEPVNVTLANATARTALSRSTLYRLAAAGAIRMVKQGRTTLIPWAPLRAYAENLPDADLRRAA
jgi:excisionase family DNA binding protein